MVEDDVQLINKVLAGDAEAFTTLVRKHQKGVHALAWRKIGDFHSAEDITQDVFLRVYKHLPKLKDPSQFSGWLYVTTDRLCKTWLQKNKFTITSLEDVPVSEIERTSYERYVSAEQEKDAQAHCSERVRKLLEKLPESERTVMTLYYLGEMTSKEIGKFLGVSVNTVTSRLQRARERLQQHEELLVQEMLGSVQLPESLTQNIVRKVADMKPVSPSTGKPFLPWIGFGAAAVLIALLLLGVSNQYLIRFQKPYSFEAQSEPTVEIIDTPIVIDIDVKPDVRNQAGRAVNTDRNTGTGVQVSESDVASHTQDGAIQLSASQWTQAAGPQGGSVSDIFATAEGTIYAFSPTGIYRLRPDAPAWTLINSDLPIERLRVAMAEHEGALYIVSNDEVFTSTNDGETWKSLGPRPAGDTVGLVVVDEAQERNSHARRTMYLTLEKGVFRSTDVGAQWTLFDDGLMDRTISAVEAVGNRVFIGTDNGLYRLESGAWERLLEDVSGSVYSLSVAGDSLYVSTGPDFLRLEQIESKPTEVMHKMYDDNSSLGRAFYSRDLGTSWTEITPTGGARPIVGQSSLSLLVVGETIFAETTTRFRSRDGGQTWVDLGFDMDSFVLSGLASVAGNENTFYKAGKSGVYRTTDGGESWHLFMDGMIGTGILDLGTLNNKLYAHTGDALVQSMDGGESWKTVRIDLSNGRRNSIEARQSYIDVFSHSWLTVADNRLYVILPERGNLGMFRLSADGNRLVSIKGAPAFEVDAPSIKVPTHGEGTGQVHSSHGHGGDDNSVGEGTGQVHSSHGHGGDDNSVTTLRRREHLTAGAFAVSDETFYAEYKRQLFKWHSGDSEWKDTGLVDTGESFAEDTEYGFKLAVSGETVYVGKRDGKLFQSLDSGDSWKDITPTLPLLFTDFTEILFAGSTVYIATDRGVLASQTGAHWRVITDEVTIDRFAVSGATLYGAGDKGVYQLDRHGEWKQISPSVPGEVLSLVVHRDRLYVATQRRGMFHISLAEAEDAVSRK